MIQILVFYIPYKVVLLFVHVLIWSTQLRTLLDENKIVMLVEI